MSINSTPPICFIVFKRPIETRIVFDSIRRAKPKKLFIYGDGPRAGNLSDQTKVQEVKKIFKSIDWDCDIYTHFSDVNLGSKVTESAAISHFFSNVDHGIILEDDCLPNDSFFTFCAQMLHEYESDSRIMHIAGTSLLPHLTSNYDSTYYFSNVVHGWGWATWRRAWSLYDIKMKEFPGKSFYPNLLNRFKDKKMAKYYLKILINAHNNKIDCWDYQWMFTIWNNDGLCITPARNLIKNIGFGIEGTYCTTDTNNLGNLETSEIGEIFKPNNFTPNFMYDKLEFYKFTRKKLSFYLKHYPEKLKNILFSTLKMK